jgi:hypothetical protein
LQRVRFVKKPDQRCKTRIRYSPTRNSVTPRSSRRRVPCPRTSSSGGHKRTAKLVTDRNAVNSRLYCFRFQQNRHQTGRYPARHQASRHKPGSFAIVSSVCSSLKVKVAQNVRRRRAPALLTLQARRLSRGLHQTPSTANGQRTFSLQTVVHQQGGSCHAQSAAAATWSAAGEMGENFPLQKCA